MVSCCFFVCWLLKSGAAESSVLVFFGLIGVGFGAGRCCWVEVGVGFLVVVGARIISRGLVVVVVGFGAAVVFSACIERRLFLNALR